MAITRILLQSRKNNLILIGEPGVGKTGVVEGFAQLMADGSLPEELGKTRIIEISLPSLVAGTKYRGEFEERMEAVEWSVRYLPDFRLPDKALDLVDQACAAARFRTLTPQGKMKNGGGTPKLP